MPVAVSCAAVLQYLVRDRATADMNQGNISSFCYPGDKKVHLFRLCCRHRVSNVINSGPFCGRLGSISFAECYHSGH